MHRKYFSIILFLTFLCLLLILFFFFAQRPLKRVQSVATQPTAVQAPFPTYIKAVGIVEPESGNIDIGVPFNRIVKKIDVSVNDQVKKGDVLFQLDHQDLAANLRVRQKEYEKALAHLDRLKELPRKEDLNIAEESIKKAQVSLEESKNQYEMVNNLPSQNAISKEEKDRRLYRYRQAEVELREREAELQKIRSGTWEPDLNIAIHEVEQAQANIESLEAEIQQTYIKSPIDGTVLQIKIHEGEIPTTKTAMVLGNIKELYLRVSVDQFNITNLNPEHPAVAYRQGNTTQFPLEFIRIEPLMVPKKYLTNSIDEKIDTQVFEILYRIAKNDSRLLIGEQMDVIIDNENK